MSDAKLHSSQHSLSQFIKFSPYPAAILDQEFRYLAVSDKWHTTYGLEGKEIIGQSHYDFFPEVLENSEWMAFHRRAMEGETIEKQRDKFEREDGTVQYLEWLLTPWYLPDQDDVGGIIMYTKDITQEVRYKEKIHQMNQNLEKKVEERTVKLERMKNDLEAFSYSVSHDLRAPLRAINGFGQILEEEYANVLDGEGNRYLRVIQDNAQKMGSLIDDVLEFSRTGRSELTIESVDMEWLVKQVLSEATHEYASHDVEYKLGDLPKIKASLPMMQQLMENLIFNAFKYSSHNNEIRLEVGYSKDSTPKYHTFFVKDNGIGMDMKYKEKVFGVFERLHSEDEYAGTGVGLAIAKKIINKHEGEIWVESQEGHGSCFFFTIPMGK